MERTFLHDISTPLTTAQFKLEAALEILREGKVEEIPECAKMIEAVLMQVKRAGAMIAQRREELMK